jgi:hypothetical protein
MIMSAWQLIISQSRANNAAYDGDRLPLQNWVWPQGTWFQRRLHDLRKTQREAHRRINSRNFESSLSRWAFAGEGVAISIRAQSPDGEDFDQPGTYRGEMDLTPSREIKDEVPTVP